MPYPFTYDRNPYFRHFDLTLKDDLFFENEVKDFNRAKLSKKKRLYIDLDHRYDYPYISTLDIIQEDYGFKIAFEDKSIILVNAGTNIYYLAYFNLDKKMLKKFLAAFMVKENASIDVSKYPKLYKDAHVYPLYEKR